MLHNREALRPFWEALSRRHGERVDVAYLGDSISEGLGADDWSGRPPVALQSGLRAEHPVPGEQGAGHVPALTTFGMATPGLQALSGALTPVGYWADNQFGLGSKALQVLGDTLLRYDFVGSHVRVWYGWDDSTAEGEIRIDGGPWQRLSEGGDTGSGHFWESPDLSYGNHHVEVRGTAEDTPAILEGFEVSASDGDRAAGIHVHDSTHSGYFASRFAGTDPAGGSRMWQVLDEVRPDLTVVNLGVNDPAWGFSAAATGRAVRSIVARAGVASGGDPHAVLVIVNYTVVSRDPDYAARWQTIREELLSIQETEVAVLDMQASWPVLAPGQTGGLMLEEAYPLHPNPAGHARQVSVILDALRVPTG